MVLATIIYPVLCFMVLPQIRILPEQIYGWYIKAKAGSMLPAFAFIQIYPLFLLLSRIAGRLTRSAFNFCFVRF
jgi:hypothetical protein